MESDIPAPDFSVIDLFPAAFHTQVETFDSGIRFPDVPAVIAPFGFSLVEEQPISCTLNSSVYQAVDRGGQSCALKISQIHTRLFEELSNRLILGECPSLVSSYDIFATDAYTILQMELCPGGDLHKQKLKEMECWQLIATVGHALAHIHENGFLHLDVSPSNIFRSESDFKLGDFGTLRANGEFRPGDEGAGAYAAPEVFNDPERVSGAADIFSLGVCLLEAASAFFAPRGGEPLYTALREGKVGLGGEEYPCQISDELRQVVNAMLRSDPDSRPCAELISATARWALTNLRF
jgi:membrane-associated tyrosine/threonine-specific cdc2-inhibitory kinase